jgi:hypothetical protein
MNAKRGRPVLAFLAVVIILAMSAGSVSASSRSASTYYPNGTKLTANIWIQSFTWDGCGDFASSSIISATPSWIKNTVTLTAYGIGASIAGFSLGGSGGTVSASWTNSGGQRGAYLSGRVCANWLTWYVGAGSAASAYHYGTVRLVSAAV